MHVLHIRICVVACSDVEQRVLRVVHLVWDSYHQVVPPDRTTGHRLCAHKGMKIQYSLYAGIYCTFVKAVLCVFK